MTSAIRSGIALAATFILGAGIYVTVTEARAEAGLRAQQSQQASTAPGDLEVLQLRPNFFMIAGAGGHIGVQVGDDGVVVVDAGSAARAAAVVAAIKKLSPRPIRYVIDTSADPDHVGGNETLS
jgi:glyoxylase-like metal-dependent hydrolase (beta-lactamase superfamily II)